MASSSTEIGGHGLPLEEIVFSCGVCQATVSELYASKDSNQGFHSGSGNEDGVVTKLWIAGCSHVTCGKHLEGGGERITRVVGARTTDPCAQQPHSIPRTCHRAHHVHNALSEVMTPLKSFTASVGWLKASMTRQFQPHGGSAHHYRSTAACQAWSRCVYVPSV